MSTVEHRPTRAISSPDDDPFRYGWRFVRRERPDGTTELEQVPLTVEDVLHPEENDFIAQRQKHQRDWVYLHEVCRARLAHDPTAVVLSDVRVDWDVPGLRAHGPDVAVFLGVARERNWGTFHVGREGARRAMVIEVVSPDDAEVRENDVTIKVEHYHRAGVQLYVIVDDLGRGEERQLQLIGYRHEPAGYRRLEPDARGRLWLEPVRVWLGVVGDRVACFDPETDEEIGDYPELSRALSLAEQARADAEQARADAEQARADAQARAEAETRARLDVEARLREMESELRRLRGEGGSGPAAPSVGDIRGDS